MRIILNEVGKDNLLALANSDGDCYFHSPLRERKVVLAMNNPYLDAFLKVRAEHEGGYFWKCLHKPECDIFMLRHKLVRKYAWAVPTDEAINKIASFGKIIEIGAGTGYWASLIAAAGAEVLAFDIAPAGNGVWVNEYKHTKSYFPMHQGTEEWAEVFPEYTLMLCWPPYDSPMASNCLWDYKGKNIIYIGEWQGCTADSTFFDQIEDTFFRGEQMLSTKWRIAEQVFLPNWMGIHDSMYILERK